MNNARKHSQAPRIIVGGFLGLIPAGGLTWHYLQYPLGFAALGCDVFYIEDTRIWPVFQNQSTEKYDCSASIKHLSEAMHAFGLSDRWAYRDEVSGEWIGMSQSRVREVCNTADILINVSCSMYMRENYMSIPVRALIDTDPMFTQVQCETQLNFTGGDAPLRELVDAHTHHFTFGESIKNGDCQVPLCGIDWRPTRQPICLEHWTKNQCQRIENRTYTTIMNWSAAPALQYGGETWGQKNEQFQEIMPLPQLLPQIALKVAVGQTTKGPGFPGPAASKAGWEVVDPATTVPDWRAYREFIQSSRAELSIAKQAYVKARTGWFSERSACYLASSKPVITQDTGWTQHLPHGTGLIGFEHLDECIEAVHDVERDYDSHSRAAYEIASDCFASDKVLGEMLQQLGG